MLNHGSFLFLWEYTLVLIGRGAAQARPLPQSHTLQDDRLRTLWCRCHRCIIVGHEARRFLTQRLRVEPPTARHIAVGQRQRVQVHFFVEGFMSQRQ